MLSTGTSVFESGQTNFDDLRIACETVPFLCDKRLVIVYGLLEKFAVRSSTSRAAGKKPETQTATYEQFAALLNHLPETTLLILVENELKENNPLYKMVAASASLILKEHDRILIRVGREIAPVTPSLEDMSRQALR